MWSTTLFSRSRSWLTTMRLAAIGFEEGFEPQRRLEIEMVRRLVEQQQVGLREQQRRKRHPHAPSAGECVERPMLRLLVEAEAGENARSARAGAPWASIAFSLLVDLADAMRIVGVLGLGKQS